MRVKKELIYTFPAAHQATLAEVGGKGLSLIEGSRVGFPVPPGFILSVDFFEPWIHELKSTKAWSHFLHGSDAELLELCTSLKRVASGLAFTEEQDRALKEAMRDDDRKGLFAVRSSSPDEDLEGTSFAGGYETVLGAAWRNIRAAVTQAFASCLDYRVVVYKRQTGFAIDDPRIAVIVQRQIASDVAGVGFSLDPVVNDYDEAVFTANWGLGETVVQGIATPDTFTVDKVTLVIKRRILGAKELSLWLDPSGGTTKRSNYRSSEFSLSDRQIIELAKLIKNVEAHYQKPMDVEWAIAQGKLYLLQARPITAYVPLPQEMVTEPLERRRLYWDLTLSVQGLTKPMSVMSTSLFRGVLRFASRVLFWRDITTSVRTTPALVTSGRMYVDLSKLLLLAGKKRLVSFLMNMDPLSAKAVAEADERRYASRMWRIALLPVGILTKFPAIVLRIFWARRDPDGMHLRTQQELQQFMHDAQALAAGDMPVQRLADSLIPLLIRKVLLRSAPLFLAGRKALSEMKEIAGESNQEVPDGFDRGLPHNVTTEMGMALYRAAKLTPDDLDTAQLLAGIQSKNLPQTFLKEWEHFVTEYGHRGPAEIDVASRRYREDPRLLLEVLRTMRDAREDPEERFRCDHAKRQQVYETMHQNILSNNPAHARRFESCYRVFETFGGYRETHKYYAVFMIDVLRQRILKEAKLLVAAGRLDTVEQVFDLTFGELDGAMAKPSLDLRALTKKNRVAPDRLSRVPQLPTVIDSRGRIVRSAPLKAEEGEAIGLPVSSGLARGKVKVLRAPDEKPFEKGEILVARATDPGWTPLFVNAAAVVLEVGGSLQHGALIAREYGLPCVTGVVGATALWEDGTVIEVDGSTGTIRARHPGQVQDGTDLPDQ
jgi:rifampicin phosphotransferase